MTFFCFFRIEFKEIDRFAAAPTVPSIGQQHTTDICKYRIDSKFCIHVNKIVVKGLPKPLQRKGFKTPFFLYSDSITNAPNTQTQVPSFGGQGGLPFGGFRGPYQTQINYPALPFYLQN